MHAAVSAPAPFDYTTLLIVIVCFSITAPLLWTGVVWMISLGGWRTFAKGRECPAAPADGISVHVMHTVFGGLASYNSTVAATFTEEGFHLRLPWIFKMFHPSFFVPWDLVFSCAERPYFFLTLVEFQISDGRTKFRVRLSRRNFGRMKALLPERLRAH